MVVELLWRLFVDAVRDAEQQGAIGQKVQARRGAANIVAPRCCHEYIFYLSESSTGETATTERGGHPVVLAAIRIRCGLDVGEVDQCVPGKLRMQFQVKQLFHRQHLRQIDNSVGLQLAIAQQPQLAGALADQQIAERIGGGHAAGQEGETERMVKPARNDGRLYVILLEGLDYPWAGAQRRAFELGLCRQRQHSQQENDGVAQIARSELHDDQVRCCLFLWEPGGLPHAVRVNADATGVQPQLLRSPCYSSGKTEQLLFAASRRKLAKNEPVPLPDFHACRRTGPAWPGAHCCPRR